MYICWNDVHLCVHTLVTEDDECPTEDLVRCTVNPCSRATCESYPNARCVPDYCGGCYTKWIDRYGEEVDCERRGPPSRPGMQ